MSEALVLTLRSGIEIAFIIALLSACVRDVGRQGLLPGPKLGGAVGGVVVGFSLTYGVVSGWDRETVEIGANGLAVFFTIALIIWLVRTRKDTANKVGAATSLLVFMATVVLVVLPVLGIGLTISRTLLTRGGPTGIALAAGLLAALLLLGIAALAGITLHKVTARVRPELATLLASAAFFVLLIRDATTVVQIMMVKGIIPLYDWLFRIMVPLINSYSYFFYAFMAVTAALVLLAMWDWRHQRESLEGLNPAEKRKRRLMERRAAATFVTAGLLLALVTGSSGIAAFFEDRQPQLSPATPVGAENGRIAIPVDSVADGLLHRFSFVTDGTTIRFLVIYKGSGIYGVALDACEFCGVAGYRQERGNIICNRCGAAISQTSIGFPGGCNPIPMPYQKEGDFVTVTIDNLDAARVLFAG